jgi:hypothetical protein
MSIHASIGELCEAGLLESTETSSGLALVTGIMTGRGGQFRSDDVGVRKKE